MGAACDLASGAPSGEPSFGLHQYRGAELQGLAADFRLFDQNGRKVGLSDFRGKVVVLAFMDSRCDETCPLTAFELAKAYQALGTDAPQAVFLGVNVNAKFNRVDDVAAFTTQQAVSQIPTWHFLTGAPEDLKPVWDSYSILVAEQPGEDDFEHTPGVFVIDRSGQKRWYISTPLLEDESIPQWEGPRLAELVVQKVRSLLAEPPKAGSR